VVLLGVFSRSFLLRDIETEIAAILDAFASDVAHRRCSRCGHVLEPAAEIHLP
jgi:hypothetical protein